MTFLAANLKRAILSKRMLLSIILVILCIVVGNIIAFNGIYKLEGLSIFFAGSAVRGFSPISLLAVVICTLPSSTQVIDDVLNKSLRLQLNRLTSFKYITIMIVHSMIIGFLILFIPYFILLILNLLIAPYKELYIGEYSGVFKYFFDTNQLIYSLMTVLWYGVWGSVFSVFGLASSLITKKKIFGTLLPMMYMLGGGIFFAIFNMSYLEPVGTISFGYQKDLTFMLIFFHIGLLFIISIMTIYFLFQTKIEEYV